MDPRIPWFYPEQPSSAHELWTRIWETQLGEGNMYLNTANSNLEQKAHEYIALDYTNKFDQKQGPTNRQKSLQNPQNQKQKKENRASTFGLNHSSSVHLLIENGRLTPWIPECKTYSEGLIGLHDEIQDFVNYMSPRPEEHIMRQEVVKGIKDVVTGLWPEARMEVYGSFCTGLYLPTSNMNLVILGDVGKDPLWILEKALIENGIAERKSTKVLPKASVPIVQLMDKKTNVQVNICFHISTGLKSATLIKDLMRQYPNLRFMVLLLKHFLHERDLNKVYTGGISSYCLVFLVVSFLQRHPRIDATFPQANLGVLLIEFFELYGRHFNYWKTGIRIKDGGAYLPKDVIQETMENGYRPSLLGMEDPSNPANDIGRNSFNALQVKSAFEHAYSVLSQAVAPQNMHLLKGQKSILGRIVRVTDDVVEYRVWIKENFPVENADNQILSCPRSYASVATSAPTTRLHNKQRSKSSTTADSGQAITEGTYPDKVSSTRAADTPEMTSTGSRSSSSTSRLVLGSPSSRIDRACDEPSPAGQSAISNQALESDRPISPKGATALPDCQRGTHGYYAPNHGNDPGNHNNRGDQGSHISWPGRGNRDQSACAHSNTHGTRIYHSSRYPGGTRRNDGSQTGGKGRAGRKW